MLNSILILIGIVSLIAAFGTYLIPKFVLGRQPFVPALVAVAMLAIGMGGIFSNGAIYYAEPGYNYLVQYPTGHQIGETSPGYHMKWWGTAESFKKFITVKSSVDRSTTVSASIDPIEARFTDSVTADVSVTARFQLPAKPQDFLDMAIAFRTQDNFEDSTLIPVLREVVRNSARTMTAQDYIAGKGGEFENSILDQLRQGTYILDIVEIKRKDGNQNVVNLDDDRTNDLSQMVKYEVNKMTDPKTGEIIRKPTALHDYHIIVTQSNVSNVDPEQKFKDMLGLQRDAAAQASVKKQEAKRAEYDKQKIVAEGEAAKASIRVDQEKLQITALIGAETQKKEAEILLVQSKLIRDRATVDGEATKIAADAQAYAKKKVIQADGALEQKLAALVAMNRDNAKALASRAVPTNYFAAGSGGDAGNGGTGYDTEMIRQLKLMNINTIKTLGVDTRIQK